MKARKVKTKTIILVICLVMLCMVCCLGGDGCIPKVNPLDLAEKTSISDRTYYSSKNLTEIQDMHCEIKYQWDGKNTISVSEVNIYWRDVLFFVKAYGAFDSKCTRYGDTNDFIKHDVKLCLEGQDAKGTPDWVENLQSGFLTAGDTLIDDSAYDPRVTFACYALGLATVPGYNAVDAVSAYFADGVYATVYFDDGEDNCGAKNSTITVSFYTSEDSSDCWVFGFDCAYTY